MRPFLIGRRWQHRDASQTRRLPSHSVPCWLPLFTRLCCRRQGTRGRENRHLTPALNDRASRARVGTIIGLPNARYRPWFSCYSQRTLECSSIPLARVCGGLIRGFQELQQHQLWFIRQSNKTRLDIQHDDQRRKELQTMISFGGAEMLISPHVVLPTLLIMVLIGLFLWNDRQNRNRR